MQKLWQIADKLIETVVFLSICFCVMTVVHRNRFFVILASCFLLNWSIEIKNYIEFVIASIHDSKASAHSYYKSFKTQSSLSSFGFTMSWARKWSQFIENHWTWLGFIWLQYAQSRPPRRLLWFLRYSVWSSRTSVHASKTPTTTSIRVTAKPSGAYALLLRVGFQSIGIDTYICICRIIEALFNEYNEVWIVDS